MSHFARHLSNNKKEKTEKRIKGAEKRGEIFIEKKVSTYISRPKKKKG